MASAWLIFDSSSSFVCLVWIASRILAKSTSYNSAVFSSIGAYDYTVFSTIDSYINSIQTDFGKDEDAETDHPDFFELFRSPNLKHLEPTDCLNAYVGEYQTKRGSVILVQSSDNSTSAVEFEKKVKILSFNTTHTWGALTPFGGYPSDTWICGNPAEGPSCRNVSHALQANISDWRPSSTAFPIKYCLSESIDQRCQLQYSIHLFIVVICV